MNLVRGSVRWAAVLIVLSISVSLASAEEIIVDNTDANFSSITGLGVPILMYHGLDAAHSQDPALFVAQMDYLASSEFQTITLDHLTSWIQTGSPGLPPKPIVLTFDDNYLSIYTVAFPTLQARGLMGYNFAHTAYVGVPPGGPPPTGFDHADWSEINEMESAGVIFTESHTVTHRNLTTLSLTEMDAELVNSKAAIEANIPNKVVRHLAYPYGAYNSTVITHTQQAQYADAVATISGVNTRSTPLFELCRNAVNPSTAMSTFQNVANSGLGGAAWTTSTSEPNFFGTDYASTEAGDGSSVAAWSFTPQTTGVAEVLAWWTQSPNRATNAPFTISHSGGLTEVRVDQTTNGGQWVSLGTYVFEGGKTTEITLNNASNGTVVADAVRLVTLSQVTGWQIY
ncbi:MAG: polysaccharide deacetylase family protein [bacterium]